MNLTRPTVRLLVSVIGTAIALGACQSQVPGLSHIFQLTASPTAPAVGAATGAPVPVTATSSPATPAPTPEPATPAESPSQGPPDPVTTPAASHLPRPKLGQVQVAPEGGFFFQGIAGYDMELGLDGVVLHDPDGPINLGLFGQVDEDGDRLPDELVDEFLDALERAGAWDLTRSDAYPFSVGPAKGSAFDFNGWMGVFRVEGQAVVVRPAQNRLFFGIGFGSEEGWRTQGRAHFSALLGSVGFLDLADGTTAGCEISADETYGYSEDNPIRVGGGEVRGPLRERAYLDSLTGSDGEEVRHAGIGTVDHHGVRLDLFQVTLAGGHSVTLYLDKTDYSEPVAPVGFRCRRPIPLAAPSQP